MIIAGRARSWKSRDKKTLFSLPMTCLLPSPVAIQPKEKKMNWTSPHWFWRQFVWPPETDLGLPWKPTLTLTSLTQAHVVFLGFTLRSKYAPKKKSLLVCLRYSIISFSFGVFFHSWTIPIHTTCRSTTLWKRGELTANSSKQLTADKTNLHSHTGTGTHTCTLTHSLTHSLTLSV